MNADRLPSDAVVDGLPLPSCTNAACTTASGRVASMASGKPISPLQHNEEAPNASPDVDFDQFLAQCLLGRLDWSDVWEIDT